MLTLTEGISSSFPPKPGSCIEEIDVRFKRYFVYSTTFSTITVTTTSSNRQIDTLTVGTSGRWCSNSSTIDIRSFSSIRNRVIREGHPPEPGAFEFAGSFLFDIFPDMKEESAEELESTMQREEE